MARRNKPYEIVMEGFDDLNTPGIDPPDAGGAVAC